MPHSPRWYAGRLWVLRVGRGHVRLHRPEHRPVRADRRGARLHPRPGLRRQPGLRRPLAGARERRLQRHPDHRAAGRASGPAASAWSTWHAAGWSALLAVRDRRAGDLRRAGAAGPALPRADQRRRKLLENSFVVPDAALADVPAALRVPAVPTALSAEFGDTPRGLRRSVDDVGFSMTRRTIQNDSHLGGEQTAETGKGRRPRPSSRPSVMVLEGRELLSTLTVSNTNDSGAGSCAAGVAGRCGRRGRHDRLFQPV